MNDPELILDRYLDGNLDDPAFAQLQQDLMDPDYADLFASAMLVDGLLHDRFHKEAIIASIQHEDRSYFSEGDLALLLTDYEHAKTCLVDRTPAQAMDPAQGPHLPSRSDLATVAAYCLNKAWRSGTARKFAAVAAICLLTLVVWQVFKPTAAPLVVTAPPAPIQDEPVALVARSSVDAVWDGGAGLERRLGAGQVVRLVQGLVELQFHDGAEVIVQAPATLVAKGPNAMQLVSGRLTATVPESAYGFVVETALGRVTDLGTEFGVAYDETSRFRADVFSGEVAFSSNREAEGQQPILLLADQAVTADASGRVHRVQAQPLAYVRGEAFEAILASDANTPHRWLAYRAGLLRDPDLLAFYPFDRQGPGNAVNLAPRSADRFHATLGDGRAHTAPTRTADRFGNGDSAFTFDHSQMQAIYIPDWHQAGPMDALTVSCWFKLAEDTDNWPLLVTHWDDDQAGEVGYAFHLGLHDPSRTDGVPGTGSGIQAHVSTTGIKPLGNGLKEGFHVKHEARSGASTEHADGWVHVALTIQCGGGPIRLYKNGVEIDTNGATYAPDVLPNPRQPLVIGGKSTYRGWSMTDIPDDGTSGFFQGSIDDVILIRRALQADEVLDLYQAGRIDPSEHF